MKVYLVRHGETTGNVGDVYQTSETPLTPEGENQARKVAERLKGMGINLIYSSTHRRAHETSKIISSKIEAEIELWESLMEIRRPKEVRGKGVEDPETKVIMEKVMKNFANPDWKLSDEENFFDLAKRANLVLDHLVSKHSDQTVLCVSHGTFIKFLVASMVFRDKLTPELFELFRHNIWSANTGVSKAEYSENHGFRLSYWNDVTHL